MTDQTDEPRRLSPDELRTLFLFESLTDEQLRLARPEAGYVESVHDGIVFNEGDEATCCYVLLSGEIRLCKLSHGEAGRDQPDRPARGVLRCVQRVLRRRRTQVLHRDDAGDSSRRSSSSSAPRRWRR